MNRRTAVVAVALAIGALFAVPADAQVINDDVKPTCADLHSGGANYTDDFTGVPTVFAEADTTSASCAQFEYRLDVYDTAGGLLGSAVKSGDGSTHINFSVAVSADPAPEAVCVTLSTTTPGGRHAFDVAPNGADAECATGAYFELDGGTGGSPMY